MPAMNAFYAQSGGVTAVINATASGVIETARKHRSNVRRAWRANNLIGAKKVDEQWLQPTFVKPKRKISMQDLMGVLRDHYEGTEYDKSLGYTLSTPNRNGATICAGGTSFSTVFGILPIAIGFGAGAESRRPLGIVVVGGVLFSTFLTLLLAALALLALALALLLLTILLLLP